MTAGVLVPRSCSSASSLPAPRPSWVIIFARLGGILATEFHWSQAALLH
ncbi:hypothetical protein HBB16_13545 [Pseudonocardia sp. MCCB 268]|nr:hypothetical protein [Pseudonocardia cytotoxica]